jgi:RNA polymerase sigma factor (sigma-70 family)
VTSLESQLQRAVDGDADALASLLEELGPRVRETLRGRIDARWKSVLTEDDIMQETYTEAFLGIQRFQIQASEPIAGFAKWLSTIANHNLLDAVKALKSAKAGGQWQRIQPAADPDGSYANLYEHLGFTTTTPSRVAAGREARLALESQLKLLPDAFQDVLRWYDLDGQDAATVAEKMNCSIGAMYMRRSRAQDLLRDLLKHQLGSQI